MNFAPIVTIVFSEELLVLTKMKEMTGCIWKYGCVIALLTWSLSLPAQNSRGRDVDTRKEMEELSRSVENITGKLFRLANTVISGIDSEVKEFKKDIEECCPEFYEVRDSLKAQTRRGIEQCRREIHRGFRQGLCGESYDPNRD